MRFSNIILTLVLVFVAISSTQAQNKGYDWGIGIHGTIYSYSALREHKVSSPYEYNRGTRISVAKYINNNFDVVLNTGVTTTRYYSGVEDNVNQYTDTKLYDGALSIKYKLDNGYIIKEENYKVSPYIKVGVGANQNDYMNTLDVSIPMGVGFGAAMGKRMTFVYETSYNYNLQTDNFMTHSVGLRFNFVKMSKQRKISYRKRIQDRRAARIAAQKRKRADRKARLAAAMNGGKIEDDVTNSIVEDAPAVNKSNSSAAPAPVFNADPADAAAEEPTNSLSSSDEDNGQIFKATNSATGASAKQETPEFPTSFDEGSENLTAKTLNNDEVKEETPVATVNEDDAFCQSSDKLMSEFGKNIIFDVNSSRINSGMKPALNKVIETMENCADTKFAIIAHTDSDGDADYNSRLAQKRADAVKKYLIENGIEASRLSTLSFGEFALIGGEKAANRRVSFKINKTK